MNLCEMKGSVSRHSAQKLLALTVASVMVGCSISSPDLMEQPREDEASAADNHAASAGISAGGKVIDKINEQRYNGVKTFGLRPCATDDCKLMFLDIQPIDANPLNPLNSAQLGSAEGEYTDSLSVTPTPTPAPPGTGFVDCTDPTGASCPPMVSGFSEVFANYEYFYKFTMRGKNFQSFDPTACRVELFTLTPQSDGTYLPGTTPLRSRVEVSNEYNNFVSPDKPTCFTFTPNTTTTDLEDGSAIWDYPASLASDDPNAVSVQCLCPRWPNGRFGYEEVCTLSSTSGTSYFHFWTGIYNASQTYGSTFRLKVSCDANDNLYTYIDIHAAADATAPDEPEDPPGPPCPNANGVDWQNYRTDSDGDAFRSTLDLAPPENELNSESYFLRFCPTIEALSSTTSAYQPLIQAVDPDLYDRTLDCNPLTDVNPGAFSWRTSTMDGVTGNSSGYYGYSCREQSTTERLNSVDPNNPNLFGLQGGRYEYAGVKVVGLGNLDKDKRPDGSDGYPEVGVLTLGTGTANSRLYLLWGGPTHRAGVGKLDSIISGDLDLRLSLSGLGIDPTGAPSPTGTVLREANGEPLSPIEAAPPAYLESSDSDFGYAMVAGDVDGDGHRDLMIGSRKAGSGGRVYVLYGPLTPARDAEYTIETGVKLFNATPAAVGWLNADLENSLFGSVLSSGDVDGNGIDDLLVTAPGRAADNGTPSVGRAYVFFGAKNVRWPTNSSVNAAKVIYEGLLANDGLGASAAIVRDMNADGKAELALGIPGANIGTTLDVGQVCLRYGSSSLNGTGTPLYFPDAAGCSARFTGQASGDQLGYSLVSAGDLNGDGKGELAFGAPFRDRLDGSNPNEGGAYLVLGSSTLYSGEKVLTTGASFTGVIELRGSSGESNFGRWISAPGNVDGDIDKEGDNLDDLLISAVYSNTDGQTGDMPAYVGLWLGKSTWTSVTDALWKADALFEASSPTMGIGGDGTFGGIGDLDRDGRSDFMIGHPSSASGGDEGAGRVYLYYGHGRVN